MASRPTTAIFPSIEIFDKYNLGILKELELLLASWSKAAILGGASLNLNPSKVVDPFYDINALYPVNEVEMLYNFFISYRVKTDQKVAETLYFALKSKQTSTDRTHGEMSFMDKYCLKEGKSWKEGFINGLIHSKVIILLISEGAIASISKLEPGQVDNMLYEWEVAYNFYKLNKKAIYPILIGSREGNNNSDFIAFHSDKFPNHCNAKNSIPIRELLKNIFEVHGCKFDTGSNYNYICDNLLSALGTFEQKKK